MKTQISGVEAILFSEQLCAVQVAKETEVKELKRKGKAFAEKAFDELSPLRKWWKVGFGWRDATPKQKRTAMYEEGCHYYYHPIDQYLRYYGDLEEGRPVTTLSEQISQLETISDNLLVCGSLGDPVELKANEAIFIYTMLGLVDE